MATSMNARISLLHKTEAEWLKLSNFIPAAGELVVYDPDENFNYVRVKAGDGKTNLHELDFFVESTAKAVFNTLIFSNVIDAGRI